MSYTFRVFTKVISTPGMFLPDLTTFGEFSAVTTSAFLPAFTADNIAMKSLVLGAFISKASRTIKFPSLTLVVKTLLRASLLTFLFTL